MFAVLYHHCVHYLNFIKGEKYNPLSSLLCFLRHFTQLPRNSRPYIVIYTYTRELLMYIVELSSIYPIRMLALFTCHSPFSRCLSYELFTRGVHPSTTFFVALIAGSPAACGILIHRAFTCVAYVHNIYIYIYIYIYERYSSHHYSRHLRQMREFLCTFHILWGFAGEDNSIL